VKVHLWPVDAVQLQYFNILTLFAYSLLLKQMKLANISTQDALPVDDSADACHAATLTHLDCLAGTSQVTG